MKTRRPRLTEKMRGKLLSLANFAESEAEEALYVVPPSGEAYWRPRTNEHAAMYWDMIDACEWITRLANSGRTISQGGDR